VGYDIRERSDLAALRHADVPRDADFSVSAIDEFLAAMKAALSSWYLVPDLGKVKLGRLTAREVRGYLDRLRRR
jgi:hypothetical protein